ncbi:segregation and condensation protein B [Desulfoluna limicola]|uniref:Segregation and condensation protein B n=1 Tax=Desulfoluna limicola TaxID=2810562 RepID=A0ABM7PBZ3_9BACT|nr:SMC-Scp complex subunit ScpB [Desulfoluna limicola]BCS95069.1 segregation and condensation protein B [Desulfoluna limicola]
MPLPTLKQIIEGLLFSSPHPLSVEKLRRLVSDTEKEKVRDIVQELVSEYEAREGGIHLVRVAGGYQFRTPAHLAPWTAKLHQAPSLKLSRAALETLAVIAYRQPVIRSEVEYLRGVDSGGIIRSLLDMRLIRVAGRKEIPGRPLIYATTRHFLELFGLNTVEDLPSPEELGALDAPTPSAAAPIEKEKPAT